MIEFDKEEQEAVLNASSGFLVKVVGVGGAGSNVLDQIALDGLEEAELLTLNTDIRTLSASAASEKIQLGINLTRGLGAGGDPELGLAAAEEAESEIRAALKGRSMVFICTGLGGGTACGASPTVARIAQEEGAFVVVFATMPFSFEGARRLQQAKAALDELSIYANALVTFDNDRMGELVLPKEGIQQAFANADRIISQSVSAVTSLVTQQGLIRIGMDDLLTALHNEDSRCLFGYGKAKGEARAQEALKLALASPLLNKGELLNRSRNVLVQVVGNDSMTLFEVQLLMKELTKYVRDEAQILFGTSVDKKMGEELSVTVITSLSEGEDDYMDPPPGKKAKIPEKATAIVADAKAEKTTSGKSVVTAASSQKAGEAKARAAKESAEKKKIEDERNEAAKKAAEKRSAERDAKAEAKKSALARKSAKSAAVLKAAELEKEARAKKEEEDRKQEEARKSAVEKAKKEKAALLKKQREEKARKKADAEEASRRNAEDARVAAEEKKVAESKAVEAKKQEVAKKKEDAEKARREAEEEARKKKEQEEADLKKAKEDAEKAKAKEEEQARKAAEKESKRKAEEEAAKEKAAAEAKAKRDSEEAARKAEEEEAARAADKEAERLRSQAEEARKAAEDAARKAAEEEARLAQLQAQHASGFIPDVQVGPEDLTTQVPVTGAPIAPTPKVESPAIRAEHTPPVEVIPQAPMAPEVEQVDVSPFTEEGATVPQIISDREAEVPPTGGDFEATPFTQEGAPADDDDDGSESQGLLELEPLSKGRFDKAEPTILDGEDLDVPTFLRKKK